MKTTAALKRGLAKVWRDWESQRFDRALAEIERLLESQPDNPRLLVMRANLIPLQDEVVAGGPTLEDARKDLKTAIKLDDRSPNPLIELGYFLYTFDDDAKAASKYFQKAIELCRELLKNALIGQAKALSELEHDAEAMGCLAEAYWLSEHNGKLNAEEIIEQLRSLQRAN
jgi:tetratricopeptide (TPR) repeat protein